MAIYYRIEGPPEELEKRAYDFSEVKHMLDDGNLEIAVLSRSPFLCIYCDEDGLMKDLDINRSIRDYIESNDIDYHSMIVGPVIVFTSLEDMLVFDGQIKP